MFLFIILIIVLGFLYMAFVPRARIRAKISAAKEKAQAASTNFDARLSKIRNEVMSVAGSQVPGKEIKEVMGMVRGASDTQATRKEEFELAEKEALFKMLEAAKSMGANAVIDIKLNTGNYEQQGSKWQLSQAIYSGTGMVV